MKAFALDFSTIAFVAAVHAIGGIGLGLWLSEHVPPHRCRTIGFSLMTLAAGLHVPMRAAVMRGKRDRTMLRSSGSVTVLVNTQ